MSVSLKILVQRLLLSYMSADGPPPLLYLQNELGMSKVTIPDNGNTRNHLLLLAGQHGAKIKTCLEMHAPDMKVILSSGTDDAATFKAENELCDVLAVYGAVGVLKSNIALLEQAAAHRKPVV